MAWLMQYECDLRLPAHLRWHVIILTCETFCLHICDGRVLRRFVWLTFACTFAMARKNGHFRPLSLLLSLQDLLPALLRWHGLCRFVKLLGWSLNTSAIVEFCLTCLFESCQVLACIDHWVFEAINTGHFRPLALLLSMISFCKNLFSALFASTLIRSSKSTRLLLCKIRGTDPV